MAKAKKDKDSNEAKPKLEPVEIIRGRFPATLVWAIRFHEDHSDISGLARKYKTTPGKISDIVNNRNFGYIHADTYFTQEQIQAGLDRVAQMPDAADAADVLNTLTPATEEQAATAEEERKAARKPSEKRTKAVEEKPENPDEILDEDLDDLVQGEDDYE